jgi:hypothetical protein
LLKITGKNRSQAATDMSDMAEEQFAAIKQENRIVLKYKDKIVCRPTKIYPDEILESEAQRTNASQQSDLKAISGRRKHSLSRRGRSPTNQDVASAKSTKKKHPQKIAFGGCAKTPRECMLNFEPMGYHQHPDRYVKTASPKRQRNRSAPKARPPAHHANHAGRTARSVSPVVRKIPAPLAPYLNSMPDPNIMYRNIPEVKKPEWKNTMKVVPREDISEKDAAGRLMSMGVKVDGNFPEPPVLVLRHEQIDYSFGGEHTVVPSEVWTDICRRLEFLEHQNLVAFQGVDPTQPSHMVPPAGTEPRPHHRVAVSMAATRTIDTAPQLAEPRQDRQDSTEQPRQEQSEESSVPQVSMPLASPPYVAQLKNRSPHLLCEG